MRLVLLSELAGKEQSVHMLENYTKNAKSDNLDYCWCWWLRGDMCLVNIGKRMVPQSLLSGVWENVKLSRILGFMSRELITQYFLFSLKFSHASWNQQMPSLVWKEVNQSYPWRIWFVWQAVGVFGAVLYIILHMAATVAALRNTITKIKFAGFLFGQNVHLIHDFLARVFPHTKSSTFPHLVRISR